MCDSFAYLTVVLGAILAPNCVVSRERNALQRFALLYKLLVGPRGRSRRSSYHAKLRADRRLLGFINTTASPPIALLSPSPDPPRRPIAPPSAAIMSDAPSQPIAPIPRTTRPMSEALLNEKVHAP